jgi:DNA replication protein DnaC
LCFIDNSRDARSTKPLHQRMQLPQPSRVQHRHRALHSTAAKHVRRISADGAWRAIRQLDHQQQRAMPSLKRPRRQQTPEQRMRLRDNPHFARQYRTQLLQSVAITVGVGKTHLATALGHIAVRRRIPTLMLRADAMFKRLKASRLDNSTETEMRRLAQTRLLIIDDFALQPMDATATADFYELVVARHQKASTVLTSNRSPDEWLAIMTDPLLAQSAVDRLTSTAHELVIEGQSYRRRQKPSVDTTPKTPDHPQ